MSNPPSTDPDRQTQDPLESLHKMLRTAGLGSQEYVAINTTAVIALILGLASFTVVFGNVLLALPVATIIIAIVAIQQIRHSAGTQTGKGLAVLGMVIALAFVVVVGGREMIHQRRVKTEQVAISALIEKLGKNLSAADYDAAWQQFDSRFKERITHNAFVDTLTGMQANPYYGKIAAIRSAGIVDVQIEPESGMMTGAGFIVFDLLNNQHDRRSATFRKLPGGDWLFEDISDYFFPEPQEQPR